MSDYHSDICAFGERTLNRIDGLKTFLLHARVIDNVDARLQQSLMREARASCVVYSMAELEALVNSVLRRINCEINSLNLPTKHVKSSLRALGAHTIFESLRDLSDAERLWTHRSTVTSYDTCESVVRLPISNRTAQPPLDGRTLSPAHFDRIWKIYELPGIPFPSVSTRMTLSKMQGLRNDLAHGNLEFHEIFSQPGMAAPDIERYLDDIAIIAINLVESVTIYIRDSHYA